MTTTRPFVEYRNLNVAYGSIRALHGVSLTIEQGAVQAVLGPNGAGKSTLAKTTIGLIRAQSGSIWHDGQDITTAATAHIVRRGLALVPESRELFGRLTVRENLELGQRRGDRATRLADVTALFPVLKERAQQTAGTLSGGEQQMLAVGRALMSNPSVLVLDEPSAGLAPAIVGNLIERLARIKETGKTVLLIEQNVRVALQLADQIAVLSSGRLVASGTPDELGADDSIAQLYFGRATA